MKTCNATLDALCDGGPLPAAVLEHARDCASCAALLRADNVLTHQPTPEAPPISPALRAALQHGGAVRPFSPARAVMPWAVMARRIGRPVGIGYVPWFGTGPYVKLLKTLQPLLPFTEIDACSFMYTRSSTTSSTYT